LFSKTPIEYAYPKDPNKNYAKQGDVSVTANTPAEGEKKDSNTASETNTKRLNGTSPEEAKPPLSKSETMGATKRKQFGAAHHNVRTKDDHLYVYCGARAGSNYKKLTGDLDLIIYIDAARFLPDNINITKCKVSFYNRSMKVIGSQPEYAMLMKISSPVDSPEYGIKVELSKSEYDISEGLWMVISLYTLEIGDLTDANTSIMFAYTVFPMVVNMQYKTARDPIVHGFNELHMNVGSFQLPLYNPRQSREDLEKLVLALE